MTRQTKLAKLKQLWTARQYDAALALVASFPRQGAAKGPVGRARAAALSPGMYAEMGHDVAALRVVAEAAADA